MLVAYYDQLGKLKEDKFKLKDEVFKAKINTTLLAQAVDTFNSNQRQSNADAKDRGEVSGGGRKPWKQKGTGRARASSNRSPLWRGGGKTFGPSSEINYAKTMNKSMRQAAIRAGFSSQAKSGNIVVYEGLKMGTAPKTKDLIKVLKDFADQKILIIQPETNEVLFNAAHNIKNITLEVVNEVNVIDVMKAGKILIIEPSLEKIYSFWGNGKTKAKPEAKAEVKPETKDKVVKKVSK